MQTNAIFPSHQTPAWSVQWVRARPPNPGMGCTVGANLATNPRHGVYSGCEPGNQPPAWGVYSGCEPGHQPPAWGVQWVRTRPPNPSMGCTVGANPATKPQHGVAFSSHARISGDSLDESVPAYAFFFFKVDVSSHTPVPFFRPGPVNSGSAS